jgi:hypothetical protein
MVMTPERSRIVFSTLFAMVFVLSTAFVVLAAYLIAELYLTNKGLLTATPPGQELAHLRMRNLLLIIGLPVMGALGFAVGWFNHAPGVARPHTPTRDTDAGDPPVR